MVNSHANLIMNAVRATTLPTLLVFNANVAIGALASYGESHYVFGRRSAKHFRCILLGADTGDLSVEQLDGPECGINLKTANALGLRIPQSVLIRADEVSQ